MEQLLKGQLITVTEYEIVLQIESGGRVGGAVIVGVELFGNA